MRHRLTIPILLAGALLVAGACGTEREPLAPAATPAPSFSNNINQPSLDDQIERLIPQLFPRPRLVIAAFIQFEAIEFLVKKGKAAAAKKLTLDLVAFTLDMYNTHRLIGDQSPQTQQKLQSFINLLFQFAGLGSAPIPPGALTEDGAVALVGPAGGTVATGNKFAGVTFPPNTFTQTVLVTLNRNGNQIDPLPTPFQQFPLFYEFKTFPEVPTLGQPAVVGVCVLDEFVPAGRAPFLRLAHPLHSDPSTLEILPLAAAPFLDCTGASDGGFASRRGAGRSMAGDLLWLMMGAPKDLHAESHNLLMPGGLGGRTSSFSTFGAVDPVLVPYKDTGYRYMQLGAGQPPPEGFEQADFNDSGEDWNTGAAAFGSGGACPLDSTVHTSWPAASGSVTDVAHSTQIVLRKTFNLPAGMTNLTVGVAIDNDVQVFVNGVNITGVEGFLEHENCATLDSFILTVPNSAVHPGTNVIVVQARDRGVASFVDIRVTGQISGE